MTRTIPSNFMSFESGNGTVPYDAPVANGAAETSSRVTVFIVEDDPLMCQVLMSCVRSAGYEGRAFMSPADFLNTYDSELPGCILLDVAMPGMSGIDVQHHLLARGFKPAVVFITGCDEVQVARQAFRQGAIDFIQKPFDARTVLERLREAIECDCRLRRERAIAEQVAVRVSRLTERERQVMQLLADGRSTKAIAAILSISPKTVDNHRARVLEKTNVDNPAELANLIAGRISLAS
jgi:FixJ family two-component response regulator